MQSYLQPYRRLHTFLLLIFFFFSGCKGEVVVKGPLSVDQAMNADVRLPLHQLGFNTNYEDLDEMYYSFSNIPELRLDTYFVIENSEGKRVRVARMSTFNLNGQLVNIDETKGDPQAQIIWAKEGKGGRCKVLPRAYKNDRITGRAFQSCLFWLDEDLNQYKLYTIWSEDEAINFVNSLVEVEKVAK